MKKVKLDLNELQVETFNASPDPEQRGTAIGHDTFSPYESQCCMSQYMNCTYDARCQSLGGACTDDPVHTDYCNTADCLTFLCGN
jgi:hypothetical protein